MKVYWHGTDRKWVMSVIRFAGFKHRYRSI